MHGIVQNFACNVLTLKDDVDIFFEGIRDTVITVFPEFLEKCRSCALLNEIALKLMCKMCIIRNNSYIIYAYIAQ